MCREATRLEGNTRTRANPETGCEYEIETSPEGAWKPSHKGLIKDVYGGGMREEWACERDGHARGMGMREEWACQRDGHVRGRWHARRIGMREKAAPRETSHLPHAVACRVPVYRQGARVRGEVALRVLGGDPALDGDATGRDAVLHEPDVFQGGAGGDAHLGLDQVDAGDFFGD
eukprot:scaffold30340_cov112-Isochrysis_galbana.AAC.1